MKPIAEHIFIIEWPQSLYSILYDVGELVAETEGQKGASYDYESFLQPSLQITKAMIRAYIGIQTGMSEKNSQIGSVKSVCQLFTVRVRSWSNL